MRRGRPSNVPLKVDPSVFGSSLQAWWILLQPGPRAGDKLLRSSDISNPEWKPLLKSHRNGFALIMIGISWWGYALKALSVTEDKATQLARWNSLVEDVDWVLQKTLSLYPTAPSIPTKRKIGQAEAGKPSKRGRH